MLRVYMVACGVSILGVSSGRSPKQEKGLSTFEICGMPERKAENVTDLVHRLGQLLGIYDYRSVVKISRLRAVYNRPPQPIAVQVNCRADKELWINRANDVINLSADLINDSYPTTKLIVREFLMQNRRKLCEDTRKLAGAYELGRVWTNDSVIYITNDTVPNATLEIHNRAQLDEHKWRLSFRLRPMSKRILPLMYQFPISDER